MCARYVSWFLIAVLCLSLAGCVRPVARMFHGWSVEEPLPLTAQEGAWETFDVSLQFQSVRAADTLSCSGQVSLTQHYHLLYNQVQHFSVYLFLVDDRNSVVQTVPLLRSAFGSTETVRSFAVTVELPPEATAIAFGYRGDAYELDGSTHFDLLPSKSADSSLRKD